MESLGFEFSRSNTKFMTCYFSRNDISRGIIQFEDKDIASSELLQIPWVNLLEWTEYAPISDPLDKS